MRKFSLLILLCFWTLIPVFSQSESVIAYHHKAKDFQGIMLLDCNVGYYYLGPHLFVDEIFAYEIKGNKIIRTFDTDHSFKQRIDTLIIKKNSVQDFNGLSFNKVKSRERNKLIERYILPTADLGFYEKFLQKTRACEAKN